MTFHNFKIMKINVTFKFDEIYLVVSNKSQRIRICNITSETTSIRFGVPQGSVLGPVLFNLYLRSVYRLVQYLKCNIVLYADNHQIIKSFHASLQIIVLLQQLNIQQLFSYH